jgi:hypothetical protein
MKFFLHTVHNMFKMDEMPSGGLALAQWLERLTTNA